MRKRIYLFWTLAVLLPFMFYSTTTHSSVVYGAQATDASNRVLVSKAIPLTSNYAKPYVALNVPSDWTQERVNTGDGEVLGWKNPDNPNEEVLIVMDILRPSQLHWNVKDIVRGAYGGVTWKSVSSNGHEGTFVDTRRFIPWLNRDTTLVGYGRASIVTAPLPVAICAEVWAPKAMADRVLQTVHWVGTSKRMHAVYVFSQKMLETMYAVEYFRLVGPISPSEAIQSSVNHYAPLVSLKMLKYAPRRKRSFDSLLIQNIESALKPSMSMELLKRLPGFTLNKDQLPSGLRVFWYPTHGKWSTWQNPTIDAYLARQQ